MKGVSDTSNNKSSEFLDKLESSHDLNSVGTDQLLDMLEHEVYHACSNKKELDASPSSKSKPNANDKRRSGAERRRRISVEGYSSGEASFTSSFLGGLEEDKALAIESEVSTSRQGDGVAGKDRKLLSKSLTRVEASSKNTVLVGSPVNTGNYSDSNMSQTRLRRQPFDNPFRSQKHDIFYKRDDKDGSGSVSVASASSKSRNGMLTTLGGRNVEKQSVSFSSKDKTQSYARKPNESTSPQSISKKYDLGDSQFETFSLGSLGSLAVSASTRTSYPSHITKSTRSSRSSRSSRSTQSGSTNSSHSAQERRQRRELHPDGSIGSSRRRRRRSGSNSRDLEMGAKTSRRRMHPDLHSHHPTRYPKRSGMYGQIEEGDEDNHHERFDELYDGIATGGSDDEGLFRRVDKVKKSIKNDNNDDFLDSLLVKKPAAKDTDCDNKSIGEASFLSNFLNKRAIQNGTKQRKGPTAAASSVSSMNRFDSTFKDKENRGTSKYVLTIAKQTASAAFRKVKKWYKAGYLFPRTRVEFVKYGLMAMIVAPLFHVALTILIDGDNHMHRGRSPHAKNFDNEVKRLGSNSEVVLSTIAHHWEGSSQVMLSASSSLKENFILIPDADWIDLKPKPPERLALPPRLDHRDKPDSAIILFSISASNGKDDLSTNMDANINLWESIREQLHPKPIDVWPSWYHDAWSHFREDGFTLMYSIRKRDEAKRALIIMAEKFGQSSIYEFVAWNDFGHDADSSSSKPEKFAERLRGGKTDVMIRTTISTQPDIVAVSNDRRGKAQKPVITEEPVLVMRRVKELPVEDELTLREFEGPPLEDILWGE